MSLNSEGSQHSAETIKDPETCKAGDNKRVWLHTHTQLIILQKQQKSSTATLKCACAVVSSADVTDDVNFNTTATRSMQAAWLNKHSFKLPSEF